MVAPGEGEAPNYGARGLMHNISLVPPVVDHKKCAENLLVTALILLPDNFGMLLDESVQGGAVVPLLE